MSIELRDSAQEAQSVVRTEFQIRPHEGPTGIRVGNRAWRSDSAQHTPQLAVPADWTTQARCLNDWKAFAPAGTDGERNDREPSREVAKALCGRGTDDECPVLELCLSTALEEEGKLPPSFRAGVRGGLTPSGRFDLAKGLDVNDESSCPRGHARREFGYWDGARWRCDECARIRNAQEVECSCGRTMRRNTLYTHRLRKGCASKELPPTFAAARCEEGA